MTRRRIPRAELIRYYREAVDFWLDAVRVQEDQCLQSGKTSVQERIDMNFYVVAVQRLREVARMTRDRLQIRAAGHALDKLDKRWPRLKELRNSEEHVTGPGLDASGGIWYFGNSVTDLQGGGRVEYIIRVEDAKPSIRELHKALEETLAVAE